VAHDVAAGEWREEQRLLLERERNRYRSVRSAQVTYKAENLLLVPEPFHGV
jgi:hypothetical protein